MIHAKYVGPDKNLRSRKALIIRVKTGIVKAQFDDRDLGKKYSHSWTEFRDEDFVTLDGHGEEQNGNGTS